jgi:hypothetical protein
MMYGVSWCTRGHAARRAARKSAWRRGPRHEERYWPITENVNGKKNGPREQISHCRASKEGPAQTRRNFMSDTAFMSCGFDSRQSQ